MSLDLDRLENVKPNADGSARAACPACREVGSDKSGDHLLIQPNGSFGCAAHNGDKPHRQRIFALAGAVQHREQKSRIVATYPYTNERGELLFEVVRMEPKTFRQRHKDASGALVWNMTGVRRVLYGLPQIMGAIQDGLPVYVCEGEKDVASLAKAGFAATCNPGGAGKWLPEFSATLRGADVCIIADKDEPGRKHAQLVARSIHGTAAQVRVIELPDTNGQPVKDSADYFAAGGTAEGLQAIVEAAPLWSPPQAGSESASAEYIATGDEAETKSSNIGDRLAERRFVITNRPEQPEPRFYIGGAGCITPGNLAAVSAAAKAGKSAFIDAMIAAPMAPEPQGCDCLGVSARNPGGLAVVHLDTEQCLADHWNLIDRALRRARIDAPPSWLRSYCVTGFTIPEARESVAVAMEQAAQECGGIFAVIVDGIADLCADLNDSGEANGLVCELHGLAIEYACPIIGVIHTNPGTEKTRGHLGSQLERKAEANLKLEKEDGITTVWSDKNRRAPILKSKGPRFAWNDQAGMHLSVASVEAGQDAAKKEKLRVLARDVFETSGRPSICWNDALSVIEKIEKVGRSGARKKLDAMRGVGAIAKDIGGQYVLA